MSYLITDILCCMMSCSVFACINSYCAPSTNKGDCVYSTDIAVNENTLVYSGVMVLRLAIKLFHRNQTAHLLKQLQ